MDFNLANSQDNSFWSLAFNFFSTLLNAVKGDPLLSILWGFSVILLLILFLTLVLVKGLNPNHKLGFGIFIVLVLVGLFIFSVMKIPTQPAHHSEFDTGRASLATSTCHEFSPEDPRHIFTLFRYGGADSKRGAENFSIFRSLLEKRIKNLALELLEEETSYGSTIHYLKKLKVCFQDEKSPFDIAAMEGFQKKWQSLGILSGAIFTNETPARAVSTVFLGDSGGNVKSTELENYITPEEFFSIDNLFSVIIYYSLAMDAKRIGSSNRLIIFYLTKANIVSQQLLQQSKKTKRFNDISRFIQQELTELLGT